MLTADFLICNKADFVISGVVDVVERLGDVSYIYLKTSDGKQITVATPGTSAVKTGQEVSYGADKQNLHFFDSNSNRCS